MIRWRGLTVGLALALLVPAVAASGADEKDRPRERGQGPGLLERLTKLVPPDVEDKLRLTEEQKKQVSRLQDQYEEKTRDLLRQVREEREKHRDEIRQARRDKDREALRKARQPMMDKLKGVVRVRNEYERKVRDLLTDEQKKIYDESKIDLPILGGRDRDEP